jgi:ATP-dependent protease ClpP protease subunit
LFALSLVFTAAASPARAQIAVGEISVIERTDNKDQPLYFVQLNGGIGYPMAERMKETLATLTKPIPILLKLNSGGGSRNEGLAIIEMLEAEIAKGRVLHTSVENGEMCGSMCVPIFMLGKKRYGAEGALFMFHGASKAFTTNVPSFFPTEEMLIAFVKAGMSKDWLEARRREGVFSKPGAYWISGRELFDAKANVVTHTIPRHALEEPWAMPFDASMGPR